MPDSSLDLFAVTAPGLEALTARELHLVGVTTKCATIRGGVEWRGGMRDVYAANLWLRTASRVLVRVAQFHAASFHELERRAKRVPWTRFVGANGVVRFRVTCHKSALYHSDAIAERLARSVVAATGAQADTSGGSARWLAEDDDEQDGAEQVFIVRVDHDVVSVSADSSGALLHRRGYRQAVAKAPLRETLAAAMLLASGWDPATPLIDPLCGSGTIPIEAALISRRIAPGIARSFAFATWPDFDERMWVDLRSRALEGVLPGAQSRIVASDRDAGAVQAAVSNAVRAGVAGDVEVVQRAVGAAERVGEAAGWVMTNPPYGIRIGRDLRNLYARLGALMRTPLAGWRLGILSASPALERQLGVPLEQVFEARNGGIKVRFLVGGGRAEG